MDTSKPTTVPRAIRPPIPERPSQYELYLRDKESFFRTHPVKLTPFAEIMKILTPAPCPDPAQFDLVMREIHEQEKAQGASSHAGHIGASSQVDQLEGEAEPDQNLEEGVEWSLDKADIRPLSSKKLKALIHLPTLHKVTVKNLGGLLPSHTPERGIVFPASALRSGFPVPMPSLLC